MKSVRLAIVAILLCALPCVVRAQELTTDAERTWRELRNADDAKSKLMAERWYGAIRLQEWKSASGKFKTSAKYVAHDPNFAWVKLRIVAGTGANRKVKDVEIPLEKLDKVGQARVKQIAVLTTKVAEQIAANEKAEDEKDDGTPGEVTDERGERLAEETVAEDPAAGLPPTGDSRDDRDARGGAAAGLAGLDPQQAMAERDASSLPPAVAAPNSTPLPPLLPPLPSTAKISAPPKQVVNDSRAATPPAEDTSNDPAHSDDRDRR